MKKTVNIVENGTIINRIVIDENTDSELLSQFNIVDDPDPESDWYNIGDVFDEETGRYVTPIIEIEIEDNSNTAISLSEELEDILNNL